MKLSSPSSLLSSLFIVGTTTILETVTATTETPSLSPSNEPTRSVPEMDEWDIFALPNTTINFDDNNTNSEMIYYFKVHDRDIRTSIYMNPEPGPNVTLVPTCSINATNNSDAITSSWAVVEDYPGPFKKINVTVDIDPVLVQESSYITYYPNATFKEIAYIRFCLKVESYDPSSGLQINYYDTKNDIQINMMQGFSLSNAGNLQRDDADETTETTEVQYGLEAYQCTSYDSGPVPSTLSQGSLAIVCIDMNSTAPAGVYVADVVSINYVQQGSSGISYAGIVDGVSQALTAKDCNQGQMCVVSTSILSAFVDQTDPQPIDISGTAVVAFGASRRLSLVTNPQDNTKRMLQSDQQVEDFAVIVPLESSIDVPGDNFNQQDVYVATDGESGAAITMIASETMIKIVTFVSFGIITFFLM